MSCKLADKCDNVFACNILRPNVELLGCNFYKPKEPLTNEEYINTNKGNELRDFLWNEIVLADWSWSEAGFKAFTEWLKEIHHAN